VAVTLADCPSAVESAVTQVASFVQATPLTVIVVVMFAAVRFAAEEVIALFVVVQGVVDERLMARFRDPERTPSVSSK
jgi:hypothetical protein